MAGDLISRDALLEDLRESKDELKRILEEEQCEMEWRICEGQVSSFAEVIMRVKEAPAVDAEPVRHGEWKKENSRAKSYLRLCSACGKIAYFCGTGCSYKYCPNCGAKMRKDNESE